MGLLYIQTENLEHVPQRDAAQSGPTTFTRIVTLSNFNHSVRSDSDGKRRYILFPQDSMTLSDTYNDLSPTQNNCCKDVDTSERKKGSIKG